MTIRLAISSDNHLDINKVNVSRALDFQTAWLSSHQIDYYLYAGDLFNNRVKTDQYFDQFQHRLANTQVRYILGNHDLLNHSPFAQVEHSTSPLYIHNQFIDLANSNWRIIGNNGWYDYSFSAYQDQPEKVRTWKNVYWLDSSIDQPFSDQQRMKGVLSQVSQQLSIARQANRQVLFITHFAPRHELLAPKPAAVNTARREYFYQMSNAMMGSDRLGQLLEASGIVRYAFYGHLHGIHLPLQRKNTTYFNQTVGVRNKRINEWQTDDFFSQWEATLRIIELT